MPIKPEIMAPVSNMAMLEAAVHNGADSVYIGMPGFNARGRSDTLSLEELRELIEYAHLYDVKVYIAFNVLIFENEIESALELFARVNEMRPDAFIVQDIGLASLILKNWPGVSLHASTQMTIVNVNDLELYGAIFKRFTLSRELSFKDIEVIRKNTKVELEVFIHGSLCISYSGQCFTSSGFGGRSANRGECAQSCRHEYDLLIDDRPIKTSGQYLVSPGDLMGVDFVQPLTNIGVDALKIEGRLKSPEYVAAAVHLYNNSDDKASALMSKLTYNRNAKNGWLNGSDYLDLVNPAINSHTGLFIGKVQNVGKAILIINMSENVDIQNGDGLFVTDFHKNYGGYIYQSLSRKKDHITYMEISLSNDFPYEKIKPGMSVFLTSSPDNDRLLKKTFTHKHSLKRIPVDIKIKGSPGEKLHLKISDGIRTMECQSEEDLEKSLKLPLNLDLVKKEISALSATPFEVRTLDINLSKDLFLPNKIVKVLRQKCIEKLIGLRKISYLDPIEKSESHDINSIVGFTNIEKNLPENQILSQTNRLNILVRSPHQLDGILKLDDPAIETIYLDFSYGNEVDSAIQKIRENGIKPGITTARIYKPGEEKALERLIKRTPDVILVRNATAINYIEKYIKNPDFELIGDFSLNISNHASAAFFLNRNLKRITASYDLISDNGKIQNPDGIFELLEKNQGSHLEVCLSYFLPSFYMDYCLFSKHLANGLPNSSCGQPCRDHSLALKDRKGEVHPVIADHNCRNEMFNGKEKNISHNLTALQKKGIKYFRVELRPDGEFIENDLEEIRKILARLNS